MTDQPTPAMVAAILRDVGLLNVESEEDISVCAISGGNTNRVYRVSHTGATARGGTRDFLLRLFGYGTEVFIDRQQEALIYRAVSSQGLCPKLLATFSEGRIEEFVPGQPLSAKQFRSGAFSALIARQLRAFHSIADVKGLPKPTIPPLIAQLRAWATKARSVCGSAWGGIDVASLEGEVDRLEARLLAVSSPVCLCHNDVNHLNILLRPTKLETPGQGTSEGTESEIAGCHSNAGCAATTPALGPVAGDDIVFIDLEYAGWNYRGFDLGNLLCEWASDFQSPHPCELDFSSHYPTTEEQKHIARAYLGSGAQGEAIEALVIEMNEFALASHLLWGMWGLIQSKMSTSEFESVSYAQQRLAAYFEGMRRHQRQQGS